MSANPVPALIKHDNISSPTKHLAADNSPSAVSTNSPIANASPLPQASANHSPSDYAKSPAAHSNADTHANSHSTADTHANSHSNADTHAPAAHSNADTHANSHSNADTHAPAAHSNADTHANAPAAHSNADTHANSNPHTPNSVKNHETGPSGSAGIFASEPYSDGKYTEPPFVKPIHFSDIDHWKLPDRNYYVFICISFVFGFFGLDHFYMRSFGTGVQKFIFNMLSLGMWYFWDLTQIISNSKKVQEEGLTTPFDWIRGVGRGIFEDPVKKAEALKNGGKIVRTKKDIVIYAIVTLLFGIFGLDKLYIGAPWQALAKLLTCFNIFIFLFGWMWVIWDIVKVLFFTESLMKDGISAPPPFNLLFSEVIKAKDLFLPSEVSKEDLDKETKESGGAGLPMPKLVNMESFRFLYKELAVPLLQPTVGTTVQTVNKTVAVTEKAVSVGTEVAQTGPKIAAAVTQNLAAVSNPDKMVQQIHTAAEAKAASRVQTGGGIDVSSGPIIAGTLAAVLLAGACKFISELLSHKK